MLVLSCAVIGAGESAANDIDASPPRLAVEGLHIVPDWESRQESVALSGEQDSAAVGIKLNSADGAPSKEFASQDASSCSCKKCQLIHAASFSETPASRCRISLIDAFSALTFAKCSGFSLRSNESGTASLFDGLA
jgi:hypothetical protein